MHNINTTSNEHLCKFAPHVLTTHPHHTSSPQPPPHRLPSTLALSHRCQRCHPPPYQQCICSTNRFLVVLIHRGRKHVDAQLLELVLHLHPSPTPRANVKECTQRHHHPSFLFGGGVENCKASPSQHVAQAPDLWTHSLFDCLDFGRNQRVRFGNHRHQVHLIVARHTKQRCCCQLSCRLGTNCGLIWHRQRVNSQLTRDCIADSTSMSTGLSLQSW